MARTEHEPNTCPRCGAFATPRHLKKGYVYECCGHWARQVRHPAGQTVTPELERARYAAHRIMDELGGGTEKGRRAARRSIAREMRMEYNACKPHLLTLRAARALIQVGRRLIREGGGASRAA